MPIILRTLLMPIVARLTAPALAALGVFFLTLILGRKEFKNMASRVRRDANQNGDHEQLNLQEAKALAEKLSSHVSVPEHELN